MEKNNLYYLMHKDIIVCQLYASSNGNLTLGLKNENAKKHMPVGVSINDSNFSTWWKNRCIPDNRDGIKQALKRNGYDSSQTALLDNLGLSLTDCYWIRPKSSPLKWESVNLYKNNFIDTIGEALFQSHFKINKSKNKFMIASSSGELRKKWFIDENNKRVLIKGNIGKSYQQSLNEIFISKIHHQLNSQYALNYEKVNIAVDNSRFILGCKCNDFCNEQIEFISASEIIDGTKMRGSDNVFDLFKQECIKLGMSEKDFDNYMDYLILTDFIFTNTDRHLNNIGILRNPDTLNLIGFSPIFDCGNSMFYNYTIDDLKHIDIVKIKINSFFNSEKKMLKRVKNFGIINLESIKADFSIYNDDIEEEKPRYELIEKLFYRKIELLKKYQKQFANQQSFQENK